MMPDRSRSALIAEIAALPARLEAVVSNLDDVQLDTPYRTGGWTVRQVVHHLADSHMNAYIRMKLALTEDRPRFKTYEQDEWARLPDSTLPLAPSLSILRGLHERWATLLEGLPAEEIWARVGEHPESGSVTLDDLLASYTAHGARHVRQIADLRAARGWL